MKGGSPIQCAGNGKELMSKVRAFLRNLKRGVEMADNATQPICTVNE
jgi:hypothetical protein